MVLFSINEGITREAEALQAKHTHRMSVFESKHSKYSHTYSVTQSVNQPTNRPTEPTTKQPVSQFLASYKTNVDHQTELIAHLANSVNFKLTYDLQTCKRNI